MNIQDRFNNLSSSIYNFICDYRKYCKWYFYDNEIPDLDSLKNKLNDEDKGIDFMSDLSDMFRHFVLENDFANTKEEKFFDTLCSIFKEYNIYLNSYEKDYKVSELTDDLVKYVKESDPYEYRNNYTNDEDAFKSIKNCLYTTSGVDAIRNHLNSDIEHYATDSDLTNNDILNYLKNASDLLIRVNEYYKELTKENSNEMDM